MKKKLLFVLAMVVMAIGMNAQKVSMVPDHSKLEAKPALQAQQSVAADEPIITIKTNRFKTYGASNNFQFTILAAVSVGTTQIEVDFGQGRKTYTVSSDSILYEDEENEVITGGTMIAGTVGPMGIVRIYGNATDFDYFDCHGSEVYDIDLSKMTALSILELGHNELKSLDISGMPYLEYLDVKDNNFTNGLTLGNHASLKYLNINQLGDHALDATHGVIDLSLYPALRVFSAWDTHCLMEIDPSKCKYLQQLSVDNTGLQTLDVTKNEYLMILNISDTRINHIDLSGNPNLVEFYSANEGQMDPAAKLSTIDFSHNPNLQRIFVDGNNLTTLDVRKQWNLVSLYAANNRLTEIRGVDVEKEPADQRPVELAYLDISGNYFTYATLPIVDPMTYFYYELQHNLPTKKEYGVLESGKLDLSEYILREGTENAVVMAMIARDGYSYDEQLFEGTDFEFDPATGIITFLTTHEDSVQVAIINNYFTDITLLTNQFLVRSAEDYGKPMERITLLPAENKEISFSLTTTADETVYVDFGDGVQKDFATTAHVAKTITGEASGTVRILVHVDAIIEALEIDGQSLAMLDVNRETNLRNLSVTNCDLKTIDLGWNHQLQTINLSGNKLDSLDLTGNNNAYHKNLLTDINVSNNGMKYFNPGLAAATILTINASNNQLTEISLDEMNALIHLDLSNNLLKELIIDESPYVQDINVQGNLLKHLNITTAALLHQLNVADNLFTFSTLREIEATIVTPLDKFIYAPQKPIVLSPISMGVNLVNEYIVNSRHTTFVWKEAETDKVLEEGVDYTFADGKTTFLPALEGKRLYGVLTNEGFPELSGENALRTTVTEAVDQPKYEIASFTTPTANQTAYLSLAATQPDTYIYIDWGDGGLEEYLLQTTYTLFEHTTIRNAAVKVYSNTAPNGNMGIFSIGGITMKNIDLSKLTDVFCLSLYNAGLTSIDMSALAKLRELSLEGNKLTRLDLSNFSELTSVDVSNNGMTALKLPENNHITWFYAAANKLTTIDDLPLSEAYHIDVTNNQITTVNMSKIPYISQFQIAYNQLHSIDLAPCRNLRFLDIAGNYFDFSTLPNPDEIPIFHYGLQAPLTIECVDGKIDLSNQIYAWDEPTEMYFFEGELYLYEDENGELQLANAEFEEGVDFFNEDGIITFVESQECVTGMLYNDLYPNLLLYTNPFAVNIQTEGIEHVESNHTLSNGKVYNVLGQQVDLSYPGVLIQDGMKMLIKK